MWPNLWRYPGICLEELRRNTKNLNQDSQSLNRDLNPGPTGYKAGVLINHSTTSEVL
jgi:hypothetical protein